MFFLRNRRSFTIFELLVAVNIILIFIGIFAVYANITLRVARGVALQSELSNIRMSIEHYRLLNHALPDNLSDLLNRRLTGKGSDSKMYPNKYLTHVRVDKEGNLLDPFGNRYGYNKLDGTVYSQTRGHERW